MRLFRRLRRKREGRAPVTLRISRELPAVRRLPLRHRIASYGRRIVARWRRLVSRTILGYTVSWWSKSLASIVTLTVVASLAFVGLVALIALATGKLAPIITLDIQH